MKIRIVLSMLAVPICFHANAQNDSGTGTKKLPEIGLGVGITSFQGDIGKDNRITDLSKLRTAYNLRIAQPVTDFLDLQLSGTYGKLAESERSATRNLNFQTNLIQADLHAIFKLDNGFILPKDAFVSPYIGAGIGFTKFDPHADLKNENGQLYYYWDDGSIRNLPQLDSNYDQSAMLYRDYKYETQLKDPATNYKRSTFSVPLLGGVKFKLSSEWAMSVNYTHYITFTDYIDNYKDGSNDRYWYASFGLHYNIGGRSKQSDEVRFADVDFAKLSKLDSDNDGVKDEDDECQGTPSGVEVTSKGCPKDEDNDGIPDHQDKQKNSPLGAVVDPTGVAIDDATLEKQQIMRDSLATERSEVFLQNPSLRSLQAIDAKIAASGTAGSKPLPPKFLSADTNKDGIIQSSEISAVIDGFFEGSNDFTVAKINELIDYFFEQ